MPPRSETSSFQAGAVASTAPLGLIGGMSWRSANLYYQRINHAMERRHGAHRNATGMLASLEYSSVLEAADAGRWDQVEAAIIDAGRRLQDAGCRVVALTAVTAHLSHDALSAALDVPVPHVLDATAARLDVIQAKKVGVLGTARTCAASFTVAKLATANRDVAFVSPQLQAGIDHLIQERLTVGTVTEADRAVLVDAIRALAAQGADAVVLACTELPLLLPLANVGGLPELLDAVDLHAEALCDLVSVPDAT